MAFEGDDDRRVRRKFDSPREKPLSHVAEEQQALVELPETGGAMMSRFGGRKL